MKSKKLKNSSEPFTVVCPNCKESFLLDDIYCGNYECDMCGSHSYWTLCCDKCSYEYEYREV